MSTYNLENIHWLGHASFRIDAQTAVIYIDPWQLGEDPKPADLILITHDHRDHCSPDDVKKIQTRDTLIVTIQSCLDKLEGRIDMVEPGDRIKFLDVDIQAVPAYNLNKFRSPGVPFHPKDKGYIGIILDVDGQKVYHTGDTDVIPEMEAFDVDIALLPVSGTYVMTVDEALEAANIIKPKVVIPMHIGRGIGSDSNAQDLKDRSSIPVALLPIE